MIEKLDKKMEFVEISILGNEKAECLDFKAGRRLNLKINELIDAVNELHEEAESNARTRADHEHKIEVLQENQNTYWTDVAEIKKELLQTPAENVLTKTLRMDKEFAENECVRLQAELERTRKALDVAVKKAEALKELADIAGFGMFSAGCQDIIEQITALEQKDK